MYMRFILVPIFTLLVITITKAQATNELKKTDATHSFKDLKFGSSYNDVKEKLQLKEKIWKDYPIHNSIYLSIGIYKASHGYVSFFFDKLNDVNLTIELNSVTTLEGIIGYFTKNFGKPHLSLTDVYEYPGTNVSFKLYKYDKTVDIHITSRNINPSDDD